MPIEGISNIRRYPRIAKIRLGIKKEGQKGPYPVAVDYFVCPDQVKAVYGEKPTELDVMFPSEKIELFAPQFYKCYSYSQGLICRGDGIKCTRKVDTETGDFASKDTKHWELVDADCDMPHCPMIGDKQCRRMMSLMFLLPKVPGLGVYQLDTSSFYSIVNINSQLAEDGFLRYFTNGKISSIPLKLSVVPQEVNPPGAGRKTVHVLNVRADLKLADIIQLSGKTVAQVLLPTVDDSEPPDDIYPPEVLQEAEDARAEDHRAQQEMADPFFGSFDSPERSTPSPTLAAPTPQQEAAWDKLGRTEKEKHEAEIAKLERSRQDSKGSKGPQKAPNSSNEAPPPGPVSGIKPREEWDKITQKDVPGYIELEMIYCRLTGKSNRDMYPELGGGGRTDQTIPAWDAFLGLKFNYYPNDKPE